MGCARPKPHPGRKIRNSSDAGGGALRRILRMWEPDRFPRGPGGTMHPEILRELTSQRGREMRARAEQATLARSAIRARRSPPARGPGRRDRHADHPGLRGRLVPDRPGPRPGPAGRAGCRASVAPPETAMSAAPSPAAGPACGPAEMSDPRGMLTAEMSGRASSPVLVGRDEQMAALERRVRQRTPGRPVCRAARRRGGRRQDRLVERVRPDRGRGGGPGADRRLPGTWHRRAAVRSVHRRAPRSGPRDGRGRGGLDAARPDHAGAGPAAA